MLKILRPGLFTTLQDQGRFGLLNKGVPVAGFMDSVSAHTVNRLLENPGDAAVLEITMTGPSVTFEEPSYICFGGARMKVGLNKKEVEGFTVHKVKAGDILSFDKLERGCRSYLGIKNGFKNPKVLGSRSLYAPVTPKSHLEQGDTIPYDPTLNFSPKISGLKIGSFLSESLLEVSRGPEFELLETSQQESLFSRDFTVSNRNDRMAYQLQEKAEAHKLSILTSATLPGTVQLTPSGRIIVLMKDGQTTGGYPRVLQLSDKAISILAQKKFGDTVRFSIG
ncbi:MAG: biotin-dependent carboxyltransferase family protein [Bacteroidota bacterium]